MKRVKAAPGINRIKEFRELIEMTQGTLAEAVGITQAALSQYEHFATQPSIEIARGIAKTLGKTIEEVFPQPEPIMLRGEWSTHRVWLNGKEITPEKSLSLVGHSTSGFAWGYAGSGPAQLALAILLELVDKKSALNWYHDFKMSFIARLPEGDFEQPISCAWLARISGRMRLVAI